MDETRLVLIGQAGVGKTSLLQRVHGRSFDEHMGSTIGASLARLWVGRDQLLRTAKMPGDRSVQVWDTAGQERYANLMPMYYRGAAAAIVVHDGTSDSIDYARRWIAQLRKDGVHVVVWQTKIDLGLGEAADVDEATPTRRVSSLTGEGVKEGFEAVVRAAFDAQQPQAPAPAARLKRDQSGWWNAVSSRCW